jgi:hypothetical protein
MLLEKQRLITTNLPLYGIEDLHYADPYADDGWLFGQKHYNRSTQALAMNSKASRTQEQIHIHVCDIKNQPCNQSGRTRDILSCLDRGHYKNMESVPLMPGDTKCKVANNTGSPIDIAEDIKREMQKDCNVYIGAGIITDRKDYTWACVTDSPQAAEWIYCN